MLIIIKIITVLVPLLIMVAYTTLAERKVMGIIQRRKGPNVVGIWGLLQPFADGLKMFVKETVFPNQANLVIFIVAPALTFLLSLIGWAVIPFGKTAILADLNVGILYLLAISSLAVYGIICSGWASNSKYAFLGALRSSAQMISYEVSIGLIIINVLLFAGSLNINEIIKAQENIWYMIPLFPLFLMFLISGLAETNRPPFDLPEAEAELVAGYNVEYSAMGFALFFIGEYANIILMSTMTTILFLGGWIGGSMIMGMKIGIIIFFFIWARSTYPRYRYDQLMTLGWKSFLPLSLGFVVLVSSICLAFEIM